MSSSHRWLLFAVPMMLLGFGARANECISYKCVTWPGYGDCTECVTSMYNGATTCNICGPYSVGCPPNGCFLGGYCDTGCPDTGPENIVQMREHPMRPLSDDWILVRAVVKRTAVRSRQRS